jgi:hypothetical protein
MSALKRISDAFEVTLYELNERNHWLFRLLEWCNEVYARVVFRGVRRDAYAIDDTIRGRSRSYQIRFLRPDDLDLFADLIARFDFKYLPPHPLDRRTAERVLHRPSYLPFLLLRDGEPTGYCLVRLLAPRRAFTGVWSFPVAENAGLSRAAVKRTGEFTDAHGVVDYVTVPLDNEASKKGAEWAGWHVIRQNRRFFVLRRPIPERLFPWADPGGD